MLDVELVEGAIFNLICLQIVLLIFFWLLAYNHITFRTFLMNN